MSSSPEWLDGLISNKNTLISKLESVGFLGSAFIRDIDDSLTSNINAVMQKMSEIDRLEDQLKTSDEDSVATQARQFLQEHGVIPDEDLRTAVEAPKVATPRAEKAANVAAAATAARQQKEKENDGEAVTPLTADELESVPKYMKGRLSLAEVNEIVRTLSSLLKYKHDLLGAAPSKLSMKEKDLVYTWRDQGADASTTFCLDTELRDRTHEKHKKNLKTVLPILRHVKRIREVRDKGSMRIYPLA